MLAYLLLSKSAQTFTDGLIRWEQSSWIFFCCKKIMFFNAIPWLSIVGVCKSPTCLESWQEQSESKALGPYEEFHSWFIAPASGRYVTTKTATFFLEAPNQGSSYSSGIFLLFPTGYIMYKCSQTHHHNFSPPICHKNKAPKDNVWMLGIGYQLSQCNLVFPILMQRGSYFIGTLQ